MEVERLSSDDNIDNKRDMFSYLVIVHLLSLHKAASCVILALPVQDQRQLLPLSLGLNALAFNQEKHRLLKATRCFDQMSVNIWFLEYEERVLKSSV